MANDKTGRHMAAVVGHYEANHSDTHDIAWHVEQAAGDPQLYQRYHALKHEHANEVARIEHTLRVQSRS